MKRCTKEDHRRILEPLYDGLNKTQDDAADQFISFIFGADSKIFRLEGVAGSGKSFLTARFIRVLLEYEVPVLVTAPTHQAAGVIRNMLRDNDLNVGVTTIHDALNLIVKSEVDGDGKVSQRIVQTKSPSQNYKFLIVDEASMLDRGVAYYLQKFIRQSVNTELILIGDFYQLPPVNEAESVCRSWPAEVAQLTEVMRNSGELLKFATVCRKWITKYDGRIELPVPKTELKTRDLCFVGKEEFDRKLLSYRQEYGAENTRLIGHTNKIVSYYSRWLRAQENPDLPETMPYAPGSLYMTTVGGVSSAASFDDTGQFTDMLIRPTTELKFLRYEKERHTHPHLRHMGDVFPVGVFEGGGGPFKLFVTPWESEIVQELIGHMASSKGYAERHRQPQYWNQFYNMKFGFASLADAGAMTVHRSQGSQFEHVFVTSDAFISQGSMFKDPRLSYVAATRCQKSMTICIEPLTVPEPENEEQASLELLFN